MSTMSMIIYHLDGGKNTLARTHWPLLCQRQRCHCFRAQQTQQHKQRTDSGINMSCDYVRSFSLIPSFLCAIRLLDCRHSVSARSRTSGSDYHSQQNTGSSLFYTNSSRDIRPNYAYIGLPLLFILCDTQLLS